MSWPLAIAIVSLLVSTLTLYLVHFRKASVSCQVGPQLLTYYADHQLGCSLGILLPVTFINSAARTGSVLNVAITLFRSDTPQQHHLMMWRRFEKLNVEKDQWEFCESAHAVAVPGNSAVTKMIWFMWTHTSQPKLILGQGSYKLRLHFWESKGKEPTTIEHGFVVGTTEHAELEHNRETQLNRTVQIWLDKELEHNRSMTADEVRKLLGVSA